MKRRLLPLVLAAVLALSGCTGAPVAPSPAPTLVPTSSPAPTERAAREFALAYYPEASLHPITGQNRSNLLLAPLVYQGLFVLDRSFTPQNQLCRTYQVSEDALVWTFTLKDAAFSDGEPLTADHVAASLRLAMAPESLYAPRLACVERVSALPDGAVSLTLSSPNAALPALLDVPIVKAPPEGAPAPLGTGDYAFAESGDGLLLRRVTALPAGSSAPAEIPLRPIRQTDNLIYAFDTQAVSLVSADLTGTNTLGYSGSLETWDGPTTTLLYVGFNTVSGPCADRRLRQALSYGLDRSATVTLLGRHAQESVLPVSPLSPLWDRELSASLGYSRQTMESLLEDAGWSLDQGRRTDGRAPLSLTLLVNTENSRKLAIAETLAQSLERSGLTVTLKKLTWDGYTAALAQGEFDLYLAETRLTADFDLSPLVSSQGALNYGLWNDEETDALLLSLRSAPAAARSTAAGALFVHLANTAPLVPLCFKTCSVLSPWGALSGLTPTQQNIFYGFDSWGF